MKAFLLFTTLIFHFFTITTHAQSIDTKWQILGFTGEAWYINPNDTILKTQSFNKGEADGEFFQCNFAGLSTTYTSYTIEEFLANKEFILFKNLDKTFQKQGAKNIFVHRITCEGKGKPFARKVMYPFITVDQWPTAYYLFEGGYFTLYAPNFKKK